MIRRTALALLILGGAAGAARAQVPAAQTLFTNGVRAYQDLEFDSASAWLRRGLGQSATASAERLSALGYLGASEHFRGSRDSAVAAFRRGLLLDPRFRLSQLIFPPDVLSLFEDVRLGVKVAAAAVPAHTELAAGGDRLVTRIYASSYHEITATVTRASGEPVRTLYTGSIGDSLEVLWDGRDERATVVPTGSYTLVVVSRVTGAGAIRTVSVPLTVTHGANDTLPWPAPPADSLFRPERTIGAPNNRALFAGLGAATAAAILPSLVGGDNPSGTRMVVAGAISVSGFLGFLQGRRGRAIAENVTHNAGVRAAWQRGADDVQRNNAQRRATVRVIVDSGTPVVMGR